MYLFLDIPVPGDILLCAGWAGVPSLHHCLHRQQEGLKLLSSLFGFLSLINLIATKVISGIPACFLLLQ